MHNKKDKSGGIGYQTSFAYLCTTHKSAKEACHEISEQNKEPQNQIVREWDEYQVTTRYQIIESTRTNVTKSWTKVANDVGNV